MEQAEDSSPDPSSSACEIRKKLAEVLRKPYPQKNDSAKPSPFVSPHQDFVRKKFGLCLEYTTLISMLFQKKNKKVQVKHTVQSPGLCGPASLQILLSHFNKSYTEEQLMKLASATMSVGTEHEGMIQAAKEIGGFVFAKEGGTIEELKYFIDKENIPVIIGWFDKDGDHYSVVISVTEKNIIISDPAEDDAERWLDKEMFPDIWFDFVGAAGRTVSWGWYMVVTFEKKKFPIKGGYYY